MATSAALHFGMQWPSLARPSPEATEDTRAREPAARPHRPPTTTVNLQLALLYMTADGCNTCQRLKRSQFDLTSSL